MTIFLGRGWSRIVSMVLCSKLLELAACKWACAYLHPCLSQIYQYYPDWKYPVTRQAHTAFISQADILWTLRQVRTDYDTITEKIRKRMGGCCVVPGDLASCQIQSARGEHVWWPDNTFDNRIAFVLTPIAPTALGHESVPIVFTTPLVPTLLLSCRTPCFCNRWHSVLADLAIFHFSRTDWFAWGLPANFSPRILN